jgi:hypothetical protein
MTRRVAGWPIGLAGAAALVATLSASPPSAPDAGSAALPLPDVVRQLPDTVFRHEDHRSVDCLSCHTVDPVHGAVRVRTLSDCRSCHHRAPLVASCASCHSGAEVPAGTYTLPRTLELSVGPQPERLLPFLHSDHGSVGCASCHTEGLALSAAAVSCGTCHQEHHLAEARCASCHLPVLETPPHAVEVHVGCGGAGCHQELPFEGVPRTRALCVACHQDMEDHRTGQPCTNCHLLPRPRPAEVVGRVEGDG